jgi:hypothetical protein
VSSAFAHAYLDHAAPKVGSRCRQQVFAGMIGVTIFGTFLTPVFYVLLRQLSGNRPFKLHSAAPQLDALVPAE